MRSFALHDCERKELDSKKGTCQGVTEGPHIHDIDHSVFCATRSAESDIQVRGDSSGKRLIVIRF